MSSNPKASLELTPEEKELVNKRKILSDREEQLAELELTFSTSRLSSSHSR